MRKTADDCKEKLRHRVHDARLKLIFDWVKNDEIAYHTFEELIEFHQSLDKQDLVD